MRTPETERPAPAGWPDAAEPLSPQSNTLSHKGQGGALETARAKLEALRLGQHPEPLTDLEREALWPGQPLDEDAFDEALYQWKVQFAPGSGR